MQQQYAMILAGGGGTRLWPMSRKNTPKQFLPLIGDKTTFRLTVDRLLPSFKPEQIYVVTGRDYIEGVQAEAPDLPTQNIIVEPHGRDSAAAAALGLTVIHKRDPQAVVAMLAADHFIADEQRFRDILKAAAEIARLGHIVTLGIKPSSPSTGFGYIQQGDRLGEIDGFAYHTARRFTEKPDMVTATRFLASGHYSWNAGMFIWETQRALNEFQRQQPAMYNLFAQLLEAVDTPDYATTLETIWAQVPKTSIDFAIMEHAENMVVIPATMGWSDVGTWKTLHDILPHDEFGNAMRGAGTDEHIILDTKNTLVLSDKLMVTIGVEDLVVIETDDALLICHRNKTQDVREVVRFLRESRKDTYL